VAKRKDQAREGCHQFPRSEEREEKRDRMAAFLVPNLGDQQKRVTRKPQEEESPEWEARQDFVVTNNLQAMNVLLFCVFVSLPMAKNHEHGFYT